jgi:peptidyl-tRNA hydrolase
MARAWRTAALLLLNTLLLLAAAEGLAAALLWWTAPRPATPSGVAELDAQRLWADMEQLTVDYWPHVGWRAHPLRSGTLNVDESGNRVTPGADCRASSYTVLVFGGSATFGYGVADADTLPARLQRALAERVGQPVCVRNFGQFGWSSTQGVIALLRELQERAAPDLVVFHDEIDLAPGRFRMKAGGGAAGNNGIRSITGQIGPDFRRARLGVGHPGHKELVQGHVLSDFHKVEHSWLNDLLHACAEAAPLLAAGEDEKYQAEVMRLAPADKADTRQQRQGRPDL